MPRMHLEGGVSEVASQLQRLILQLPREESSSKARAEESKLVTFDEQDGALSSSALFSDLLLLQEQAKVLVEAKTNRKETLEAMTQSLENRIAHLVPPTSLGGASTDWSALVRSCVHSALNKKKSLIRIERQLEQYGVSWNCQDGLTPAVSEQQKRHRLFVELAALQAREAKFRDEAACLVSQARGEWSAVDGFAMSTNAGTGSILVQDEVRVLEERLASLAGFEAKLLALLPSARK